MNHEVPSMYHCTDTKQGVCMDRIALNKVLRRWNPWWAGEQINILPFHRSEFLKLTDELLDNKISVIAGPRQTGKTTLVYQIVLNLLSKDVNPKNILYLLMDDVVDELQSGRLNLREILDVWVEDIVGEKLNSSQKYVFFDEVQLYKKWSREIKSLDQQALPIKFFVTGSSSVDILKGTSESLAGRISRTIIMPLKFWDILNFYLKNEELKTEIFEAGKNLTIVLEKAILDNDVDAFFSNVGKLQKLIIPIEDEIKIIFNQYFQRGGYPEIALTDVDDFKAFARLKNYIDSVVHKDFINFFNVRDTRTLERILKIISKNTSSIISERGIAKDLGVSINTIRNHLSFLEQAFLVLGEAIFTESIAKETRRPQKLYIVDIGLGNALVGYDEADKGNIMETIVHNHMEFLALSNPLNRFEMAYWRQKYEVDLILSVKGKHIPIEVKYAKTEIGKGIGIFANQYKTWGIVVSNELSKRKNILFIPAHIFLLLM